jgi:GntR family transcriptional repressor for pyruvate dehydrogenase complex
VSLVVRGRAPKAAELVADDLAGHILLTGMKEGDVLPNEREMTELLGVGRSTLREALRILETQGVITIRPGPGGGPVVRRPRPDDLAGNLTLLLQFMDVPFGQVVRAREVVEPLVAREAAVRATPDHIAALRSTVELMGSGNGTAAGFLRENSVFHMLLAQMAGNPVLQVVAESLRSITAGFDVAIDYGPAARAGVAQAHQRIIDALAAGDGDAAGREAARHMAEFRLYVESRFPDLLARPVRWVKQRA